MIKTKAIRKMLVTTMSLFLVLTVFSLSFLNDEKALRVNMEIVHDNSVNTSDIYLLGENGYLIRKSILLDKDSVRENTLKILDELTESDTTKFSNGFRGVIPKECSVLDVIVGSNLVTLNFSKEFLNVLEENEKKMIESVVFSVLDYTKLDGVVILVEGELLTEYPNSKEKLDKVLTKNIGINKQYNIKSRDNLLSVVLYYVVDIDGDNYYVPVTKYLNDTKEKIDIIVEELVNDNINDAGLMSFLNNKVELIEYDEANNVMVLNFNEYLFDYNNFVLDEVLYSISYSVFENYDVNMVMFEVNGEEIGFIDIKNKK